MASSQANGTAALDGKWPSCGDRAGQGEPAGIDDLEAPGVGLAEHDGPEV